METGKFLNIGCGDTFHSKWTNIDLVSVSPEVHSHNILQGLPYPDASFDACYSSHVLEHLLPGQAQALLGEAWRVLKPQGVIRVVVPDLEMIVKIYLDTLRRMEAGATEAGPDYDWMILELYDQTTRRFSGGEMGKFLSDPNIRNIDFIVNRIGPHAKLFWNRNNIVNSQSFWSKVRSKSFVQLINRARVELAKMMVGIIAGRGVVSAFEEGLFRNSGEIHRWMYDRFSLRRLLEQAEFVDINVCDADESRIPNFDKYQLDMIDGKVRKPDSLFMEGIKS